MDQSKRINGQTFEEWAASQFEFEYCEECGGDPQHHTPAIVMGNWFAVCAYPPSKETDWKTHPAIQAYQESQV